MCGISGQFNFATGKPVDPAVIRRMADSLSHRGPDDHGYFIDQSLGLGFRRLSIIDLTGGHQPMSDAAETVWVIFNGEIYNHVELREELTGHGHRFRTRADTEVLIHGYKQWGLDVFEHLKGMFGVALWDVHRRRLILARDAMGIKLVYYRVSAGQLLFGSEVRAVQAGSSERPEVDPIALSLFLQYRFTPSPHTIYKGIKKLSPGTMLIAEPDSLQVKRWYKYSPKPFSYPISRGEASEELRSVYRRAVKRHLRSDVPVGLLLSGGVDSGLLLGLMSEEQKGWPTYTVGYGSTFEGDELDASANTATHFGARHSEVRLDVGTFDDALRRVVSQLEEPVAASSIVPMYFVCQRARRDVKVVLSGQGPDEMFGGYKRHLGIRYGGLWATMPSWLRTPIHVAIDRLPRNETLKRAVRSLHIGDRMKRYAAVLSLASYQQIADLFRPGALSDVDDVHERCWEDLRDLMAATDELGGFQFLELRSTLPDELLMYTDKMSMAHGLEVRVPFLDRDVVEFVERLPAKLKVRWGSGKWLHRQVCKEYLPSRVTRRKKRGFAVNVVDGWLRQSLSAGMEDVFRFAGSKMYELLDRDAVLRLLGEHRSRRHDHHKLLFSLIVLEHWFRGHDSSVAKAPASYPGALRQVV